MPCSLIFFLNEIKDYKGRGVALMETLRIEPSLQGRLAKIAEN